MPKLKKKVALIHQDLVLHYRVSIYNHLNQFLLKNNYELDVISNACQQSNPFPIEFNFIKMRLTTIKLLCHLAKNKPDAIILFINLKNLYLFPVLFFAKLNGIKIIYWGHAIDLEDKSNKLKNMLYDIEHSLADSILLYSDSLKKYIKKRHRKKIFIANNTLNTMGYKSSNIGKKDVLKKYDIRTSKNIIFMGRIQKRKRIYDLIDAFLLIEQKDTGLILVGPDTDNLLDALDEENIFKLGAIYGEEANELLHASDIYCLPGHVGLSIVDAFYYGLPIVTENIDHAPEIMYFKNGFNGFMVEKGDVINLSQKLKILLNDDILRSRFSNNAKFEIQTSGHIDVMCQGFVNALNDVV